MALPQAIDIRISMLRLAPQCFAFTSIETHCYVFWIAMDERADLRVK